MLPNKSWDTYSGIVKSIGERRSPSQSREDLLFLNSLGFINDDWSLTQLGARYFNEQFVRKDAESAMGILREALRNYPPAAAVTQLLFGVVGADSATVETVLRSSGFGEKLDDRRLGSFLMLLNKSGVIEYRKQDRSVFVKMSPASQGMPRSVFISPKTPFGNRAWLRKLLAECNEFIYWLDKHFMPMAFDDLWEACDGNRVHDVKILSLRLEEHSSKRALRDYRDLRAEFRNRSIDFEWRTIESSRIRDTHDRWIISSSSAWNVPNVGAIYSGQHSELNLSPKHQELRQIFSDYWNIANDLLPVNPQFSQIDGANIGHEDGGGTIQPDAP